MENNPFKLAIIGVVESLPSNNDYKRLKSVVSKRPWADLEEETILKNLSQIILKPQNCLKVASRCSNSLLLHLLMISAKQLTETLPANSQSDTDPSLEIHKSFLYTLNQLNGRFPEVDKLCNWYIEKYPQLLSKLEVQSLEPVKKKPKKAKKSVKNSNDIPLLQILYQFLCCDIRNIEAFWDWTSLVPLLKDVQPEVRWLSSHCLARIMCMPEFHLEKSLLTRLSKKELIDLLYRNESLFEGINYNALDLPFLNSAVCNTVTYSETVSPQFSLDSKFELLSLCGVSVIATQTVHLESFQKFNSCSKFVLVPSVKQCLRELTLAIKSNQPVLIEGMVGCGKTSLINFFSNVMGKSKSCLKGNLEIIQLGDQTDLKLLVGLYCCTEIPGEFIWKPGPLTKAMANGGWLLLEDIDYAPLDVITLLASVVESNSLLVPGMTKPLKAAPGFQILATQRLMSFAGTLHSVGRPLNKSTQELVTKSWNRIYMPSMSEEELKEAMNTRWPNLNQISDRILKVFSIVANIPSSQGSRNLSTRDLFKWCSRIANSFSLVSTEGGMSEFLHALDCFCFCIQDQETRLEVAADIGSHLNIPKEKTNHCCVRSKPEIKISGNNVQIGRIQCPVFKDSSVNFARSVSHIVFSRTRQASIVLESVANAVSHNEPVLLVGETGTGKTSIVQYLTHLTGQKLTVINMNQQSDSTDLLGGYKPVDFKVSVTPIRLEFEELFIQTFSAKKNTNFLENIMHCFAVGRWLDFLKILIHVQKEALCLLKSKQSLEGTVLKHSSDELFSKWSSLGDKIHRLKIQLKAAESTLVFSFIPGTLVKALKEGSWVLLDEINLAEAETLECLGSILDGSSINLLETGDDKIIEKHKNFRLFACMNPATDVGKKDLPTGIRNRFTEIYMDELNSREELLILCEGYLQSLNLSKILLDSIVSLYIQLKHTASTVLTDGTGHAPHYSLRTLCRALSYASSNPCQNVLRSLYEAFCLSFLTQLDRSSHPLVQKMIASHILGKSQNSVLKQKLPLPTSPNRPIKKSPATYLRVESYWVRKGPNESHFPPQYVLTKTIRRNLSDIARIVSAMRFPVLLQGETSVGKTSLIEWLAKVTGNICVRVNNHEHTDLQEYIGNYVADENGKLVFKEGVLVEAMRFGHWIILDELNLAPTEVLEALNRVLDDNRELFITETQVLVKAHPQFLLFATQNPPGLYGGRKVLSRAFRNRFIELHFDEIPSKELETILEKRCCLPPSYCSKLVAVMLDLQLQRRESGVFAGKQGFITLRDLFRWGERYKKAKIPQGTKFYDWDQHLADEGYLLLGGRVRRSEEENVILKVLQKHFKRTVNPSALFNPIGIQPSATTEEILQATVFSSSGSLLEREIQGQKQKIIWTGNISRLAVLVGQALKFGEPVLLVGDTGCGKTTICQILATLTEKQIFTVNCHMHSESADFLGSLRPTRNKSETEKLFEWADGPLVKAMRAGEMFLADEISLADDSVLERLNSVLEPEGTLLLAEKGNTNDGLPMLIVAAEDFRFLATMNPGGDYGKKELSPALRNRFTEIWCPNVTSISDLQSVVDGNLTTYDDNNIEFGKAMIEFIEWFTRSPLSQKCTITIRDLLSWTQFINCCVENSSLDAREAYIHGAQMTLIDSLGAGQTFGSTKEMMQLKKASMKFLHKQMGKIYQRQTTVLEVFNDNQKFGISPFYIPQGLEESPVGVFCFDAPTSNVNAFRLLRAMQLFKPILLEGSPGVGKTALVTSLARMSGHTVIRINLSEQTDISELFGADLPVEGGKAGHFEWRDGPLLEALKNGHWLLLDELNLASQSVLEGLNACLDHRGEIYLPELDRIFKVPIGKTRFFACQNPQAQGGARKGLPRSFLNRFIQVFVEALTSSDLKLIMKSIFPKLDSSIIDKMVQFSIQLEHSTATDNMSEEKFGSKGAPWEFNLRDLMRWGELIQGWNSSSLPGEFVELIYADRMRTKEDKQKVLELYTSIFNSSSSTPAPTMSLNKSYLRIGHAFLKYQLNPSLIEIDKSKDNEKLLILNHQLKPLQSLAKCVEMNWMTILVGPSGTGKTNIVKLLSSLTNHRLSVLNVNSEMDTTELLGGFEQADLSRKLGHLWKYTDELVRKRFWELMLQQNSKDTMEVDTPSQTNHEHDLQNLIGKWLECKRNESALHNVFNKHTSVEKHENQEAPFVSFLKKMQNLLAVLINSGTEVQILNEINHELTTLETEFNKKHSCTCDGGSFEWVDSVLVTAVKEGHWLLIDNVNLCSASVLDRLNPLLEPHGVLTITEQGVVNGFIPSVVPHPQFRLFLAMDPRNGEISRAMRNRGIEIFLHDDIAENATCNWDYSIMLRSLGFQDQHLAMEALHSVHQLFSSEGSVEKPSTLQLIQAAKMTIANAHQGVPFYFSILECAKNIYINQLSFTTEVKQDLQLKVEDLLKSIFSQNSDVLQVDEGLNNAVKEGLNNAVKESTLSYSLPYFSTRDFALCSTLANIRRESQLLSYLLLLFNSNSTKCESLTSDKIQKVDLLTIQSNKFKDDWCLNNLNNPEDWSSAIRLAVMLVLEYATYHDLPLRLKWAQSIITLFEDVSVGTLISQMENSSVVSELLEMNKIISAKWTGTIFEDCELLPLSLFSQPAFSRILVSRLTDSESERLEWLNNRLRLSMTVSQLKWSQSSHCLTTCASRKVGAASVTCFFHMQSLSGNSVPMVARSLRSNATRSTLIRFFEELEKIVLSVAEDLSHPFPSKIANSLLECVWFLNQLWILCDQRDAKLIRSDQLLTVLKLQWNWSKKHTLPILMDVCKKNNIKTVDLDIASKQITSELFPMVPEYHKLRSKIAGAHVFVVPEAFSTDDMAEVSSKLNSFETLMAWSNLLLLKCEEHLLEFAQSKPVLVKKLMASLKHFNSDPLNATEELNLYKDEIFNLSGKEITNIKLQRDEDDKAVSSDDFLILDPKVQVQLELLPLQEYLLSHMMSKIVNSVLSNKFDKTIKSALCDLDKKWIDNLLRHKETILLVFQPSQINLLQQISQSSNKQLKKLIIPMFLNYMNQLQKSTFNLNYKYLLTLSRKGADMYQIRGVDLKQPMTLTLMCCLLNLGTASTSYNKEISSKKRNSDGFQCTLPLGVFKEKKSQLEWLKSTLWKNASMLDESLRLMDEVKNISYWYRLLTLALQRVARNSSNKIDDLVQDFPELDELTLQHMIDLTIKAGLPGGEYGEFMHTANSAIKLLFSFNVTHFKTNSKEVESTIGVAWINVGYLTATFFAPWDSIDPVLKQNYKLEFHKKYLTELSRSLELRDWLSRVNLGMQLEDWIKTDLPKWVQEEMERKEHFSNKVSSLESKVAYRPDSSQFTALSSDVKRFFTSLATVSRVNDAYFNLNQIKQGNCGPKTAQILQEIDVWLQSLVNFYEKIISSYYLYPDLVVPFATGVAQMIHGFKILKHQAFTNYTNFLLQLKSCETFTNLSAHLGLFPYISDAIPDPSSFAKELIRPDFLFDISQAFKFHKSKDHSEIALQSHQLDEDVPNAIIIIRSALLELLNHSLMLGDFSGRISSSILEDIFERINSVFTIFVNFWEKEVEAEKLRKEEEDALYEIRTKFHESELSDEDRETIEIQENFPSYSEEFADFQSDSQPMDTTANILKSKKKESHLDSDELLSLWNVHEQLINSLHWAKTDVKNCQPNFTEPFMLRYQILSKLTYASGHLLESEPNMLNTHILASHLVTSVEDMPHFSNEKFKNKKWNIYHSSFPSESVRCYKILDDMKSTIYLLLKQYPQNPALQRILSVMKRLFSFPVSSPLMKLITGLEVVLTVSQDWEQMAHRGISLQIHLSAITALIIGWRKLELKFWSSALDIIYEKQYLKTSHWWARLYSLVLLPEKDWNMILTTLIQFMEDSTIGQFQCRLQLLELFSKHCLLLAKFSPDMKKKKNIQGTTSQYETLHWILTNIHGFYEQFLVKVINHISSLRKPIEDKLKDFVKIAQWNDLNFYRVKAAVDKSHRTIHKHSKDFENTLLQPVKSLLVPFSNGSSKELDHKGHKWTISFMLNSYIVTKSKVALEEDDLRKAGSVRSDSPLHRLSILTKKLSKFSKSLLNESKVIPRVKTLDNYCGFIVENYQDLQSMSSKIDQTLDKDERKKIAKFQYNLKRKTLANLFKLLSEIGLSYKKGLNVSKKWKASDELKNPILPISENFNSEETLDLSVVLAHEGSEKYLYQSIARLTLLLTRLRSPCKEIDLGIIHRCGGFVNHLMFLVSEKQRELSSICRTYCRLKNDLKNLRRLSDEYTIHHKINEDGSYENILPPQLNSSNWQNDLESLILRTETTIRHFKCLWDACPEQLAFDIEPILLDPIDDLPSNDLPSNSNLQNIILGDEKWTIIDTKLSESLLKLREIKLILSSHPSERGANLFTWNDIENFKNSFKIFGEIKKDFNFICDTCGRDGPVVNVINLCATKIEKLSGKFDKELNKEFKVKGFSPRTINLRDRSHQTSTNVELLLDRVIRTVLLGIQAVIKESALDKGSDNLEVKEEESSDNLDKKHLTEKLFVFHSKLFNSLRLDEIAKLVTSLITSYVTTIWESNVNPRVVSHIVFFALKTLPLLQQYSNLVHFYFTSAIAAHRVSCKLLYILSGIFSEIAEKGFCLPSDLQEELTNEQNTGTKFNEIEDGGLGEGKGAKDISDKIESEDQLEDTLKEGETKEKDKEDEEESEDKDDKKQGIEMSEDFDGDALDPEQQSDDEKSDLDDEEEDKLDKQMGEVENEESQKLDDKLWGSDSEDEENLKSDDETAGGTDKTESEVVAKSEKESKKPESSKKETKPEENNPEENNPEGDEINEVDQKDDYDGEHEDPYGKPNEQNDEKDDGDLELPDDIQLDMDAGENGEQNEETNETQEDINNEDMTSDNEDKTSANEDETDNIQDKDVSEENPSEKDEDNKGIVEEKIESIDDDEQKEKLSEAVPSTNTDTSDDVQSVLKGTGENASEENDMEVEDEKKEEHGQKSDERDEKGQSTAGYGGDSQQGQEGISDANANQSQSNDLKQQNKNLNKQTQKEKSLANSDFLEKHHERLKTVDSDQKEKSDNPTDERTKAELYQHTRENEKFDTEVLDLATEEQATNKHEKTEGEFEHEEVTLESDEDMEVDNQNVPQLQSSGQLNKKSKSVDPKEETNTVDESEEELGIFETLGERSATLGAQRNPESTIHTRHDLWSVSSLLFQKALDLPLLSQSDSIWPYEEAQKCWRFCDLTVAHLVQELCEQLRLVLEPTKTAKMKGDYRTGKRLNMRKIIPYIASQFRKDKIWLRRTKPSKRQYQIAIAVDDSSSMADNQSRQMAFESIALLGKALSLLEAGDLTILKFGENVNIVHPLGEPFTDHSGVKILQSFSFQQKKTRVAELVEQCTRLLMSSQNRDFSSSRSELTQLLIIVSDGRGVFNEGEDVVKQAIRNAKACNVFLVFIVLDNSTNKDSILDIRMPVFSDGSVTFQSYMEKFPFPFYVILREIRSMPIVLGEALRQWFELVTSSERS